MQNKGSKKKLCIFTKYSSNGPSSKYRAYIFKDDLAQKYDIHIFPFWSSRYYKVYGRNKKKYFFQILFSYIINCIQRIYQIYHYGTRSDYILFQKCIIPFINWNPTRKLQKKGCHVFLDVDDAVYLTKFDNTDRISKDADGVIAGNQTLKNHYSQYNSNVCIVPTVDYSPAYTPFQNDTFAKKNIIWIGSGSSISNLDLVVDAINILVEKHPEVTFRYICNDDYGFTRRIKNSIFIPWTEESYLKELSEGTIGIMPLENSVFNRGKCGFKLIQYLNMGFPVVASDVGVNGEITHDFGFKASSTQEWVKTMEQLLFNEVVYRKYKANINKYFLKRFGYENSLNQIVSFIDGESN